MLNDAEMLRSLVFKKMTNELTVLKDGGGCHSSVVAPRDEKLRKRREREFLFNNKKFSNSPMMESWITSGNEAGVVLFMWAPWIKLIKPTGIKVKLAPSTIEEQFHRRSRGNCRSRGARSFSLSSCVLVKTQVSLHCPCKIFNLHLLTNKLSQSVEHLLLNITNLETVGKISG